MSRLTKLVHRLTTPRRRLVPVFAIAIAATAAVAAACGGGGGYGGSSVPSATAPGGAAVAPTSANGGSTPLAGGQPGATPTAATGSSSGSMQLTVVASNTSFDKTSLNATAGEVKFTLNNKDVALLSFANGVTSLTPGFEPAWSRDGTKLVFAGGDGLYTIDVDGSNRRRLTTGPHHAPAWRP